MTRAGRVVMAYALALSLGGYNTTNNLFVLMAAVMLAISTLAWIYLRGIRNKIKELNENSIQVQISPVKGSIREITAEIKADKISLKEYLQFPENIQLKINSLFRNGMPVDTTLIQSIPGRPLYRLSPMLRGEYSVDNIEVVVRAGLGLWELRAKIECTGDSMLILPEQSDLKTDQLPRILQYAGISRLVEGGESRNKGEGLDFDGLVPWQPGEDERRIDAKASARTGKRIMRRYVRPFDKETVIALALSGYDTEDTERAISFSAGLALYSLENGHRVTIMSGKQEQSFEQADEILHFLARISISTDSEELLVSKSLLRPGTAVFIVYDHTGKGIEDPSKQYIIFGRDEQKSLIREYPQHNESGQENKVSDYKWNKKIFVSALLASAGGILAHYSSSANSAVGAAALIALFGLYMGSLLFKRRVSTSSSKAVQFSSFLIFFFLVLSSGIGSMRIIHSMSLFLSVMTVIYMLGSMSSRNARFILMMQTILLATAALRTTNVTFLLWFIIYSIGSWRTLHLANSWPDGQNLKFSWKSFISVLAATTLFFIVIPRPRIQLFRFEQQSGKLIAGFSEDASFGDLGEISSNRQVVMRLIAEEPDLLRGLVYDNYDGNGWTLSDEIVQNRYGTIDGGINLSHFRGSIGPEYIRREQEIYLEDYDMDVVFAYWQMEELYIRPPHITISDQGVARIPPDRSRPSHYRAISSFPAAQNRRGARIGLDDLKSRLKGLERFVQLPPLDKKVKDLALSIAGDEQNIETIANIVVETVRNRCSYSLTMPENPEGVELVNFFLFEASQGHCELFATASAVLLRAVGIPCRYVTGFAPSEYNEIGDYWIIREDNAHAWIEVYVPGWGWKTFDPTPPELQPAATGLLDTIIKRLDWMRLQWQRYIINFSRSDQAGIIEALRDTVRLTADTLMFTAYSLERRIRSVFSSIFKSLIPERALNLSEGILKSLGALTALTSKLITAAVFAGFIAVIFIVIRTMKRQRLKRKQGPAELRYIRLEHSLNKNGFIRRPDMTPSEWAETLPEEYSSEVRKAVKEYYQERFRI